MLKTILIVVNWWATNLLRAWWCFAQLPKRRRNKLSASAGWEAATAMNFSARPLFYSRTGERQTGFPELDCFVASEKSRQQRFFASSCNFFVATHPLPRPTPPPFLQKMRPCKVNPSLPLWVQGSKTSPINTCLNWIRDLSALKFFPFATSDFLEKYFNYCETINF